MMRCLPHRESSVSTITPGGNGFAVPINSLSRQKKEQAELLFHRIGITFNVYGEDEGTERLIPFDSVRVLFLPASGSGLTAASASG
ncbi:Uncharacterised protein [Klebsiella michiganensis]|nr:Uncharacterised protein [Klebsiella michiganensis]